MVPFEAGDRREVWVVVADELPEDGQGAGQLVDGFGSQHRGASVEIRDQGPPELGCPHGRESGLTGGWSSFTAVLGRERDHPGFEQEPAKPEYITTSAPAHWFGQPRRRIDRSSEPVEVLDCQRRRGSTGEGDRHLRCAPNRNIW